VTPLVVREPRRAQIELARHASIIAGGTEDRS
jgi:hypothetical protein